QGGAGKSFEGLLIGKTRRGRVTHFPAHQRDSRGATVQLDLAVRVDCRQGVEPTHQLFNVRPPQTRRAWLTTRGRIRIDVDDQAQQRLGTPLPQPDAYGWEDLRLPVTGDDADEAPTR